MSGIFIPAGLEDVLAIDPDIVSGLSCFKGTRVPLDTVVDNLAAGISVERILENYPTLTAEHVAAVLRWEHGLAREAAGLAAYSW